MSRDLNLGLPAPNPNTLTTKPTVESVARELISVHAEYRAKEERPDRGSGTRGESRKQRLESREKRLKHAHVQLAVTSLTWSTAFLQSHMGLP